MPRTPRLAELTNTSSLILSLSDQGMTPMLRAGLGGLAASLRAISSKAETSWPVDVRIGPGWARVEPERISLFFEGSPDATLQALFSSSFQVQNPLGIIQVPGWLARGGPPSDLVALVLQNALRRTFLQHPMSRTHGTIAKAATGPLDGQRTATLQFHPIEAYIHQRAWRAVAKALDRGSVELAGWAYPGGVQRHMAFRETKCTYTARTALCACFAMIGTISFITPSYGGAIVIPEPNDLVRFAEIRPYLTPQSLVDVFAAGIGDAALKVALGLRWEEFADRKSVSAIHGIVLRPTPWDFKQKCRSELLTVASRDYDTLMKYEVLTEFFPLRVSNVSVETRAGAESIVAAPSTLRTVIAANLALGRVWFDGLNEPLSLLMKATKLSNDERLGLKRLMLSLDGSYAAVAAGFNAAFRARLAIAQQNGRLWFSTNRDRFRREVDRWQRALASTSSRAELVMQLADLWSYARFDENARHCWTVVAELLNSDSWHYVRDLGLITVATYSGNDELDGEVKEL